MTDPFDASKRSQQLITSSIYHHFHSRFAPIASP